MTKATRQDRRPLLSRMSLKSILVLGAVVAAALPAGVFAFRSAWTERQEHLEEQIQDNLIVARSLALTLDQFLQSQMAVVQALAAEIAHGPLDRTTLRSILERTHSAHAGFDTILVVDASGTSVALHPPEKTGEGMALGIPYADRPWFKKIADSRRPLLGEYTFAGRAMGPRQGAGVPRSALPAAAPVKTAPGSVRGPIFMVCWVSV
jgi:hypothetical protein